MKMRLRCRLRDHRGDRSLRELERETGINRAYLSLIKRGKLLPPDRLVGQLEQAYGLPLDEWYFLPGLVPDGEVS